MNKTVLVALGILAGIAAIVAVLTLGGGDGAGKASGDATGDVVVGEGPEPPADPSLADISAADVHRDGDRLVFEATMASDLPRSFPDGSLEFRWDISEGDRDTWIVLAAINVETHAAVTSQRTQYGSSTIDDTLPGRVEVDGDVVRVTLNVDKIDDFPETFGWRLMTTLDGLRADTGSAKATDMVPDSGSREVTS